MRLTTLATAAVLATGCASPAMPPGGPPDIEAPRLVGIAPDSGRVSVTPRSVIFRFDEVVSESPPGATTLANLFLISPQHGTPVVEWEREEISVRPRRGWRPNTTYSISMLPGIADLRGNVRKEGAATLFSTGPMIPATAIRGVLFDWTAGAPVAGGLVQAMTADSTIYIANTDSAGAFTLLHLPAGSYSVNGVVDGNRNRALDPREAWDTVTVSLTDTARVELFAFVHDSAGPRIQDVLAADSVTLRVQFSLPVDSRVTMDPTWIAVAGPDSIPLAIANMGLPDAVPSDTAAARPLARPTMTRARPYQAVVITLATPLKTGVVYTVRATGFPGLLGRSTPSSRTVTLPAASPAPQSTPP